MKMHDGKIYEEILQSDVPTLIEFYADWCGPCRNMKPVIEEIENELKGKVKVFVFNVERNHQLADKFVVLSLPTFMVYRNGNRVSTLVGMQSKKSLVSLLAK